MMILLMVWIGLSATPAAADVVGPPPERCPPGSVGDTSHAGPTCTPITCTSALDCELGDVCVDFGLCVEMVDGWSHGYQFQMEHALTTCDEGGLCPPGATCETARRCVPRVTTMLGVDSWAIPVAGAAVAVGILLLLLLAIAVAGGVLYKRRQRKREEARRS